MIHKALYGTPTDFSSIPKGGFEENADEHPVYRRKFSYRSLTVDRPNGQAAGRSLKWLQLEPMARGQYAIARLGGNTNGDRGRRGPFLMKQQRFADFIRENMEAILQAWEDFACTIEPQISTMSMEALRHHAGQMLIALAADLDSPRLATARNAGEIGHRDSAAETHAEARLYSGYTIVLLVAEYRALRSSVLSLWCRSPRRALATDPADVTHFNEAIDQALAESVTRYQQLVDQSQNMFLAILGHDLRSPLGALVVGANLMMNDIDLSPKHVMRASRMFNSARRMKRLIDDLIDFTRTHLGSGIPVNVTGADLITVCRQVVNELRTVYPKRFVDLRTPPKLYATFDGDRFAQVLSNLIGNALQYGNEIFPVRVFVNAHDGAIEITVNNRGSIIPPDRIAGIFDAMVRLASNSGIEGMERTSLGIGLHISREIVKAHGGQITVVSNAQDGTTFTVTMPWIGR